MSDLRDVIALAIKGADNSIFNEDYAKQAAAVIGALRRHGFEIVPKEASDGLVDFACDNLPFGRLKQQDFVKQLYQLLVENARKYP